MRFLLDESADFRLGRYLADQGHDVTAISRDYPQALKDDEVLRIAHDEQRVLITRDRDFGELIFRHGYQHSGVILLRLGLSHLAESERWMDYIISEHSQLMSHFLVVNEHGLRVRRVRPE